MLSQLMASTSHNETPSSADSTSDPTLWKVMLSFRGKDTRHGFTDHLYNILKKSGIKTYRDTPELRAGEKIAKALPQAIRESKIYVVVLSQNFASSHWCLDELVEILHFCEKKKRSVLPVFYYIESSVVERQSGEKFTEFFQKHVTRYDANTVTAWRAALTEVAKISGYSVVEKKSQADIVNQIVDNIFFKLNPKALPAAEYPVGLNSRTEDITALLSSNPNCVNKFGIYGMGGVGKTSLALNVYNKNYHRFKGSSFLANVSKVSATDEGLLGLQQQLLDNVLERKNEKIDDLHHGVACIKDKLCSTKALVVIDDLEDARALKHLEALALGSIIIITTRNEDLLDSFKVEAKYKVNELSMVESRQLFARHAFGGDATIPERLMKLSDKILERAGGLPLALKDFGDKLHNKADRDWEWFVEELIQVSVTKVEKELQISYDGLKLSYPNLQSIFLDIACFFMGLEKEEVTNIMNTCYTNVNNKIDILKQRSLVTINNVNKLGMHDLLRDMGRNICRKDSPKNPGEHSRLWVSKDICDVLKKNKGTEHVEGIIPHNLYYQDSLEGVTFGVETFRKMINLRFLYLKKGNISESFEQTFDALRWLCWEFFPLPCLPSKFQLQNLIILELPHSSMTTMWEVQHDFKELKSLNLSNSLNLTTTPDFNRFEHLETLNLEGCKSLEDIKISSGSLQRLVFLNLHGCENLSTLETICELKALKVLNIGKCKTLKELPTQLGNLISLEELNAEQLTVSKLPDSIGRLTKLVVLRLSHNKNLETLPDTICNLRSLEKLDLIGYCGHLLSIKESISLNLSNSLDITTIPEFNRFEHLETLNLEGCKSLEEIDISIGSLQRLVFLNLCGCEKLSTLKTICELKALKVLNIGKCKTLKELPAELGNLNSLEELTAVRLTVSKLPDSIGCLTKLVALKLSYNKNLETLPDTICKLSSLEKLDLGYCGRLLSISELPPILKWIRADGCTSLKRLPSLSNLKQLEMLDLKHCIGLTGIQELKELTSIKILHLTGCDSSLVACTLSERFIQMYSEFGHQIRIYTTELPDWISESSNLDSKVALDLRPNMSSNFLGTILCFKDCKTYSVTYSVRNTTSDFTWSDKSYNTYHKSLMVVVPRSIFSVRDGDNRIEVSADAEIHGIHIQYKMTDENDNTTINSEETTLVNS